MYGKYAATLKVNFGENIKWLSPEMFNMFAVVKHGVYPTMYNFTMF
jgi:hypothetical protein